MVQFNGEYGCLGDLGMHALHIPLRFGWLPANVRGAAVEDRHRAARRQGRHGAVRDLGQRHPGVRGARPPTSISRCCISTKRIAPGETNTWFIRVHGTEFSAEFSTKYPKTLRTMTYRSGQAAELGGAGHGLRQSAYPTITGGIFEFGFSDGILQMFAAFCDELVHGGRRCGSRSAARRPRKRTCTTGC